jgi:nucleoside-diphosphate-sugar epimerase
VRVLVTGDQGRIGVPVAGLLRGCGYEVAGFDRAEGGDVLDLAAVSRAARGCAAIVHLAALAHDNAGSPEQIMAVNVLGTWHVLLAAEAAGAGRVVCFSSVQVFGIAEGERLPDYFPVDDAHPRRAMRPYGLSKRLAEDLCEGLPRGPGSRRYACARWRSGTRHSTGGLRTSGRPGRDRNGSRSGSTVRSSTSGTSRQWSAGR